MHLSMELLAGIATAILVLLGLVVLRKRGGKTPSHRTATSRGPSNLRFICKGCSSQFTHSKRTIGAYEKGSRSFFCNLCHSKWRETNPAKPSGQHANVKAEPSVETVNVGRSVGNSDVRGSFNQNIRQSPIQSRSGCLGAALLIVAIPIALITMAARYA